MQDSIARWKPAKPIEVAQSTTDTHTVRKGESLGSIAKKHHVSVRSIQRANQMKQTKIQPGQMLKIPKVGAPNPVEKPDQKASTENRKPETASKEQVYIVKNGDSLWKIAKRFKGVSESDIKKWNHCGDDIRPGQKLIIHIK